ncbi:hypothetical protein ACLOJK_020289 [Asimina triloba]
MTAHVSFSWVLGEVVDHGPTEAFEVGRPREIYAKAPSLHASYLRGDSGSVIGKGAPRSRRIDRRYTKTNEEVVEKQVEQEANEAKEFQIKVIEALSREEAKGVEVEVFSSKYLEKMAFPLTVVLSKAGGSLKIRSNRTGSV